MAIVGSGDFRLSRYAGTWVDDDVTGLSVKLVSRDPTITNQYWITVPNDLSQTGTYTVVPVVTYNANGTPTQNPDAIAVVNQLLTSNRLPVGYVANLTQAVKDQLKAAKIAQKAALDAQAAALAADIAALG